MSLVVRFLILGLIFLPGCSSTMAGLKDSDVETLATGGRATVDVMGPDGFGSPRSEPNLYMIVQALSPMPASRVYNDLVECQAATRNAWNSPAVQTGRKYVQTEAKEMLAQAYEKCLSPKGYVV